MSQNNFKEIKERSARLIDAAGLAAFYAVDTDDFMHALPTCSAALRANTQSIFMPFAESTPWTPASLMPITHFPKTPF